MSVTIADLLGTNDEGILFGVVITVVFVVVFVIEYVRTQRVESEKKDLKKEQYANAAVWGVMLTMLAAGLVIAPNDPKRRDISILLTCGAALQLLAFVLLWVAPRRSCPDLTLPRTTGDFAVLMTIVLSVRVVIEMQWNGYLPIDRTGDGCIQLLEGGALLITVFNLGKMEVTKLEMRRSMQLFCFCVLAGNLCYGELDGSPMPDKLFATSIYTEVAAWACMYRYILSRGRDAVNSMFLPPIFVQGLCRAYFWYMAYAETTIRKPVHFIQVQFPWVLVLSHLSVCVMTIGMSVLCVREFNPALPHKLLSPEFSV